MHYGLLIQIIKIIPESEAFKFYMYFRSKKKKKGTRLLISIQIIVDK